MRKMSASEVQPPSLSVAATAVSVEPPTADSTAASPPLPPPRANTTPAAAPVDASVTIVAKPLRWRMTLVGYVLLALGSVVACLIPQLRLRAGIVEDTLVILSISSMLLGTAGVVAGFVLNAIRQL
jgi:hypothetical protein